MAKKSRKLNAGASQKPSIIHTAIETDGRYWHPVIEIRQQGVITFAIAGLAKSLDRSMAYWLATKESRRLELQSG